MSSGQFRSVTDAERIPLLPPQAADSTNLVCVKGLVAQSLALLEDNLGVLVAVAHHLLQAAAATVKLSKQVLVCSAASTLLLLVSFLA
jgi:hypothetical protein